MIEFWVDHWTREREGGGEQRPLLPLEPPPATRDDVLSSVDGEGGSRVGIRGPSALLSEPVRRRIPTRVKETMRGGDAASDATSVAILMKTNFGYEISTNMRVYDHKSTSFSFFS